MNPRFFLIFGFALPGAIQGLALYLFSEWLEPDSFQPAVLAGYLFAVLAPLIHHLSTEPGKRVTALFISILIAGLCAVLIYWSMLRFYSGLPEADGPSGLFILIMISSFLITLISLPFLRTLLIRKQSIFDYSVLFEFAWNQCVCVLIAFLFSLVTVLITMLSVSLFAVLGFDLSDIIYDAMVMAPLLGAAFGLAIGITRQSESIIHSTRHVMLALFRALLPVFMTITGIFLVTALVVGIDNLETGFSVTMLLITSMTVSIILCNGAVQDNANPLQGIMSWVVRIQALILPGFAVLALYGLWMRMNEYGLTHGRLIALVITVVCSLYAVGYMFSALSKSLVKNVQRVNIVAALITVAVTIGLLTPVLDMHRISVNSQVSALSEGKIPIDKFDFSYLKFESGRAGADALEQLKTMDVPDRAGLDAALKRTETLVRYTYSDTTTPSELEEFDQWVQSGKVELYQPIEDSGFENMVASSGFIDSLRYSCISSENRCVITQTTEFNTPEIQYLVARSTATPEYQTEVQFESSVNIQLYYQDDQGEWTNAVQHDAFWQNGMLQMPTEELTQLMNKLAAGDVTLKPITLQAISIGNELYVPGIGKGLDVLQTR